MGRILKLGAGHFEHQKRVREGAFVKTGISYIDDLEGGILPGEPMVIGADDGVGKSGIMLYSAMLSREKVGIISLQDGPSTVDSRAVGAKAKLNSRLVRAGKMSEAEEQLADEAAHALAQGPVSVAYCSSEVGEVVAFTKKLKYEEGCRIIWLDYLQALVPGTNARGETDAALRAFIDTCAEENLGCVMLSQFSRQPTYEKYSKFRKKFREPENSWLKESNTISQKARLILLCHRSPEDELLLRARITKNSNGDFGGKFYWKRSPLGFLTEVDKPWKDYEPEEDQ